MTKNKKTREGIVYSTNPDFAYNHQGEDAADTLPPNKQKLKVQLDSKQRAGKVVTLVTGFVGKDEDLQELCKALKNKCGVGGSAKDGQIILQGDHKIKALEYLSQKGYQAK